MAVKSSNAIKVYQERYNVNSVSFQKVVPSKYLTNCHLQGSFLTTRYYCFQEHSIQKLLSIFLQCFNVIDFVVVKISSKSSGFMEIVSLLLFKPNATMDFAPSSNIEF